MSKEDVVFTIGADGSAFAGAMGALHKEMTDIGQSFMGLQGIAAGLRTVFGGINSNLSIS